MRLLRALAVPDLFRNPRRTWLARRALAILALAFFVLNVLAYRHAWALMHFVAEGQRTPKPEALSGSEKLTALFTGAVLPRPQNRRTPEAVGLAYERVAFVSTDGVPLEAWLVRHAEDRGIVLMFHGYVDAKDSLLAEAQALHGLGWNVLLVDFRGSGGSGGAETSIGFHEAHDVAAAFGYASRLPRPIVLFGVSMGAAAILKAVADEAAVRPDGMVLECPFDRLATTIEHRFELLGVPAFPSAQLLLFWGGVQGGFNGFRHNPVDYARAARCPTLLIQGDRDDRVHVTEAETILAALPSPKTLKLFAGVGHGGFLRARREEWTAAVSGFLAEIPARSSLGPSS